MKWNFFSSSTAILFLVCNNPVFSQDIEGSFFGASWNRPGNWFISLGAGQQYPQWHNPMKVANNTAVSTASNKDLFSTKNQSEPVINVAFGRRWAHDSQWFPSYSLSAQWHYFFRTHIGNMIIQSSPPSVAYYKYNWDLTANMLLASAKINLFQYKKLSPYVHVGIGSSFNRTSSYKERPAVGSTPRQSPQFSNFSTNEFAYNAGVGIDLQLTPKLSISAGYSYQDLGQISSGPGKAAWSNQALNPGSYHSNELLISMSYLFQQSSEPT